MIKTGLVSVTFRDKSPQEVITLAARSKLGGIEWGGDIHVPQGDTKIAREVYLATIDSGLEVFAYGSYYKLGKQKNSDDFKAVLETAVSLNAPTIRVWAGEKSSSDADEDYKNLIVERTQAICALAKEANVSISFEYHRGTLTDNCDTVFWLCNAVDAVNLCTFWQPNPDISHIENLTELNAVLPYLSNVHAFHLTNGNVRRPFRDGLNEWTDYINVVNSSNKDHNILLEFVEDDLVVNFVADAETLTEWTRRTRGL